MEDPESQTNSRNSAESKSADMMDDVLVSFEESERLAQEKIEARIRLLSMPLEEAQKLIEHTLYPQYWEFHIEDHTWEESIPTHYGEVSDT